MQFVNQIEGKSAGLARPIAQLGSSRMVDGDVICILLEAKKDVPYRFACQELLSFLKNFPHSVLHP